jgi:hypothetical protein
MEPFSILLRDQIAVIALADGPFALAAFSTPRNRRLEISTFHRYVRADPSLERTPRRVLRKCEHVYSKSTSH